ncbi:MAG: signal peptidase [Thermosediminibacterales bacterium]|jgi:signal peptidase I|nr:signal peptidase [Thermosediminibacterales bacterium]
MNIKKKSEVFEWLQAILIAVILALFIRAFVVEIFQVEGESMFPTLYDGERLAVNKFIYRIGSPQKGDIIVFKYPSDPRLDYIKRVIAVEGDTIEIKEGRVIVNGQVMKEEYIQGETPGNFGPEKVPENHVFVLGDNRKNSKDSRFPSVGYIPFRNLKGKAFFVIWPINRWRMLN